MPLALLAGSGCANLEWQFPPKTTEPAVAERPVNAASVADELMAVDKAADAEALMARAVADQRADEDDLLYQMGLLLLSPKIDDRAGAAKVLTRLVERFPDSPHRRAADTLLTLLKQLDTFASDNASLREDLKQILDIDLEADRQRRSSP